MISTVEDVGGDIGQDPATEVSHVRLNQPPVFFFQCSVENNFAQMYLPEVPHCKVVFAVTRT